MSFGMFLVSLLFTVKISLCSNRVSQSRDTSLDATYEFRGTERLWNPEGKALGKAV